MATVAELETRVAELEKNLSDLLEVVYGNEDEDGTPNGLEDRIERLEEDRDNRPVDDRNGTSGVNYERDEDGRITDHDGELAPTADANGNIVADPNR